MHWPEDPAHTPDLLFELEARLADGHSSAEQTKTLQHCPPCFLQP